MSNHKIKPAGRSSVPVGGSSVDSVAGADGTTVRVEAIRKHTPDERAQKLGLHVGSGLVRLYVTLDRDATRALQEALLAGEDRPQLAGEVEVHNQEATSSTTGAIGVEGDEVSIVAGAVRLGLDLGDGRGEQLAEATKLILETKPTTKP